MISAITVRGILRDIGSHWILETPEGNFWVHSSCFKLLPEYSPTEKKRLAGLEFEGVVDPEIAIPYRLEDKAIGVLRSDKTFRRIEK